MTTFKMEGNTLLYKIWKRRLEKAQTKVKLYEDTIVDITTILVPTPSLMVLKFTTINNGNKYELVLQGSYAKQYKEAGEGIEVSPISINAQGIITSRLDEAFQINE
jgi:hypothetical protein